MELCQRERTGFDSQIDFVSHVRRNADHRNGAGNIVVLVKAREDNGSVTEWTGRTRST